MLICNYTSRCCIVLDKLLDSGEVVASLIGAVVALVVASFITPLWNRRNSEISELHSESVWRSELFKLSKKVKVSEEDLELFRTFLSATRGYIGADGLREGVRFNHLDIDTTKRGRGLDDVCMVFYKTALNRFYVSFGDGKLYLVPDMAIYFRQLCRLLLKEDWNRRVRTPKNYLDIESEILAKAEYILSKFASDYGEGSDFWHSIEDSKNKEAVEYKYQKTIWYKFEVFWRWVVDFVYLRKE